MGAKKQSDIEHKSSGRYSQAVDPVQEAQSIKQNESNSKAYADFAVSKQDVVVEESHQELNETTQKPQIKLEVYEDEEKKSDEPVTPVRPALRLQIDDIDESEPRHEPTQKSVKDTQNQSQSQSDLKATPGSRALNTENCTNNFYICSLT